MQSAHQEIVLQHGGELVWCLDCHASEERDRLHLAGGERLEFAAAPRLCGQCHAERFREWQAGVHGRRSGSFEGASRALQCAHCHDAHAPAFLPIVPDPPPRRRRGGA
jgi:hypothetical protein